MDDEPVMIDERRLGEFLWSGVLSEATAAGLLHRIGRSGILHPAEVDLYARFTDEERVHGRLLADAARQYAASAPASARYRIRALEHSALDSWAALGLVLVAERLSFRGFEAVRAFFRARGDVVAVRAYDAIIAEEPAHLAASRLVLRRAPDDVRGEIDRAVAATLRVYRSAAPWAHRLEGGA